MLETETGKTKASGSRPHGFDVMGALSYPDLIQAVNQCSAPDQIKQGTIRIIDRAKASVGKLLVDGGAVTFKGILIAGLDNFTRHQALLAEVAKHRLTKLTAGSLRTYYQLKVSDPRTQDPISPQTTFFFVDQGLRDNLRYRLKGKQGVVIFSLQPEVGHPFSLIEEPLYNYVRRLDREGEMSVVCSPLAVVNSCLLDLAKPL